MIAERRLTVTPGAGAAIVVSVLIAGAGGTYLLMRDRPAGLPESTDATEPPGPQAKTGPAGGAGAALSDGQLPDVAVTLTREAADRAGIAVTPVSSEAMTDALVLPGLVAPNAYREVAVTSLVGGRVVRVSTQLGDRVRRGQSLAQVYSPELAEARTKFVAAKAMLDAHDRELQRTQKLVDIGAASRQELERIHAEHAAQLAEVESSRSRLQLLGADADESSSSADGNATTSVPAPIDGVVTERLANVGLNVDSTARLFTIVDLSNVWIVADVYEKDLHRVREGARAIVTPKAYPDVPLEGRVTYIDPRLEMGTRTAKIRVEVPNPRNDLRLGMYADVAVTTAGAAPSLSIPKSAIQNIGDRQVVYLQLPDQAAQFVEREVRVGRFSGDKAEILAGLTAGDLVVSRGSFFVRAEVERLGLHGAPAQGGGAGDRASRETGASGAAVRAAKVAVTENGFEPDKISLRAGVPSRITFVRSTDSTCGTEVVFPSLNIKHVLPLNEPVVIEFTPEKAGEVAFTCGMDMLRGAVVVE